MIRPVLRHGRRVMVVLALVAVMGFVVGAAHGTPLGLEQAPPDITAYTIPVNYDAGAGLFSASGDPQAYATAAGPEGGYPFDFDDFTRSFSLTALLNPDGTPTGTGSLTITGTIPAAAPDCPGYTGILLSGTLEQFGFADAGGEVFEFVYAVTGGALASGSAHQKAAVIVNAYDTQFSGSFGSSFANTEAGALNATADTFLYEAIPEPSSIALLAFGVVGMAILGVRRLRTH